MRRLARWHVWLGWLVGVPLLLWTVTGLWMVARPIEEVRGTGLRAEPATLPAIVSLAVPRLSGPVERLELVSRLGRPTWIVRAPGGMAVAADARTGASLPSVDAALARTIADAGLASPGAIANVTRFSAAAAPIDLRRERPSWRIAYASGVNVYIDADTGEILAVRSRQWRLFDLMWGLHIMDLETREDTSHPILIMSAALSLIAVLFGIALLFRRRARGRPSGSAQAPPLP